jgi:phosphate transport system permease protein
VSGALHVPDLELRWTARTAVDRLATALMASSLAAVAVPLGWVITSVAWRGGPTVLHDFPAFLLEEIPVRAREIGPGMGPAILGTLEITFAAAALAVPVGVLGAVWLNEYGGDRPSARLVRFFAAVSTAIPSVVMGLFVYLLWTLAFGLSGIGGSLALALLMLPVVLRSAEEMLRLVPGPLREASSALGATRSRTIATVVLPAAFPGIVSGALLAVARAAGETAPLVFTIGAARDWSPNLLSGANTALSTQIFANAMQPFVGAQDRAWGAAVTLVCLSFSLMAVSRAVSRMAVR